MIDEQIARMRTHRNNIDRYRRLMRTRLTEGDVPIAVELRRFDVAGVNVTRPS
jgi:hypothetical protein